MHDANEMECLIFENAIKNILLGKVTKSGVSDANNKLIITIFQMWGHIDPIRSGIGLNGKECTKLNGKIIKWVDHIKHLGNFLDSTLSDKLPTRSKISAFIGYVNKVKANFGHLQIYVLCKLFKLYCCSFYGSQMWKINSLYFKNESICWNKAVRRIVNVPYTTHTWMLGPILNQAHISTQLIKRCIRFFIWNG